MSKPKATLGEVEIRRAAHFPVTPVGEAPPPPTTSHVRQGRATKTHLTVFFQKPVKKQLRQIGLEYDKTLQALMTEAVNDLFAKYGRPEIAE